MMDMWHQQHDYSCLGGGIVGMAENSFRGLSTVFEQLWRIKVIYNMAEGTVRWTVRPKMSLGVVWQAEWKWTQY